MEKLKAPFPYFGGKSRWVDTVWSYFGKPDVYVEPFCGTAVMLLQSPQIHKREVLCDLNGFICNFYRAVKHDPEATAEWACYPTIHQDLTARHKWLIAWGKEHSAKLSDDPEWYDTKAAGWWVWGISNASAGSWCISVSDGIPRIHHKQGVMTIRKELPTVFCDISNRFNDVFVMNRSWESAVTPAVLDDAHYSSGRNDIAIFLDPPYRVDNRANGLYQNDNTNDPAIESYQWAIEHGDRYRIAYCMHEGDFPVPDGWQVETQSFAGYSRGNQKARDCIIFSPACVGQQSLFV